jgi:hypothetical protein
MRYIGATITCPSGKTPDLFGVSRLITGEAVSSSSGPAFGLNKLSDLIAWVRCRDLCSFLCLWLIVFLPFRDSLQPYPLNA